MNLIYKLANKYSYRSRKKRKINDLEKEVNTYMNMPDTEFLLECIETKSRYSHKKFMFTFIFVIIIFLLMWLNGMFFRLSQLHLSSEYLKTTVYLIITIMASIIFGAALFIWDMAKMLFKLNKKRFLLEELQKIR